MEGGLFIALYDEDTLKLYLNKGIYGFLMKPVNEEAPSSRSKHYAALADYACAREGQDVFFFLKRKIVYGGKIIGSDKSGSFFLNGDTSPLGRKSNASLFWDESSRYESTVKSGVFKIEDSEKSQPFILRFEKNDDTGKYIISDDLYFELGKYPFPLPSNSMQGMGFCTLTPGEVNSIKELVGVSSKHIDFSSSNGVNTTGNGTLFNESLVSIKDTFINESQLEFTILSSLKPFINIWPGDYVLCRQVPISPFKPMNMDRADICLYSKDEPIKDGTIPNIVVELKLGKADYKAYVQATRYLKWLEKITTPEEFDKIQAFVIADSFSKIKREKVDTKYESKIKVLSLRTFEFEELV